MLFHALPAQGVKVLSRVLFPRNFSAAEGI
jgi:hypothetical protein